MDAWHLWLIAGLLLALAELLGLGFFALALGLACIVGSLAAGLGAPVALQWLISGLAAAIIAPTLTRVLNKPGGSRRSGGLAGENRPQPGVLVLDAQGQLRVRVEGDLYPVRSLSGRLVHDGDTVTVRRFDGITALID